MSDFDPATADIPELIMALQFAATIAGQGDDVFLNNPNGARVLAEAAAVLKHYLIPKPIGALENTGLPHLVYRSGRWWFYVSPTEAKNDGYTHWLPLPPKPGDDR